MNNEQLQLLDLQKKFEDANEDYYKLLKAIFAYDRSFLTKEQKKELTSFQRHNRLRRKYSRLLCVSECN
jgi:hypothetical protein